MMCRHVSQPYQPALLPPTHSPSRPCICRPCLQALLTLRSCCPPAPAGWASTWPQPTQSSSSIPVGVLPAGVYCLVWLYCPVLLSLLQQALSSSVISVGRPSLSLARCQVQGRSNPLTLGTAPPPPLTPLPPPSPLPACRLEPPERPAGHVACAPHRAEGHGQHLPVRRHVFWWCVRGC